jgi:hypothetical protein
LALNPAQYVPGQSTEANTQQRRVNPTFGTIDLLDSEVKSGYNALQLTLQKRMSHGFGFLSNYTWSKALDNYAPGTSGGGNPRTNTCTCGRFFDYGPDNGDLRQVFKLSGNYAAPLTHMKGVAGGLLNGWQLSDITSWQTGFPFSVYSDADNSFSGIGEDRADLTSATIGSAVLSTGRSHAQLVKQWFNISDFTANRIGTFGDSGKNVLRGPRFFDSDLALLKNTALERGISLQFRAEFYNAFNNVNFNMPDSGLTDSAFGQLTSAQSPRILQFSLKTLF